MALDIAIRQYKSARILKTANFIDGELVETPTYMDSYEPATGEIWAKIPDSGEGEINRAVKAAKTAFESWSKTSVQYRAGVMMRIANQIERRFDEFAQAESRDQGKPVSVAKAVDIPRCITNFRVFANAIQNETNDCTVQKEPCEALNYVLRHAVGVAGLISPWNLPLYLLSFKIAPAIAYGNTVVAKPSEFTSVTAWLLAHAFIDAGLPPGVVNLVFGTGPKAGEPLVRHPDVPLISFTGSTATGKLISTLAAPLFKKLSLEMGGKNPCIVFADADLAQAVPTIVMSCFANQGEICLCTSRLYVQRRIFDEFRAQFVISAKQLKVGPPENDDSNMGAMVSRQHHDKVTSYIRLAQSEGCNVLLGTQEFALPPKFKNGYFLAPTIISGVAPDSRLMKEEIFGPVVCLVPFDSEDEAVEMANSVEYGLSASVWSQNVGTVHRMAQRIQAGTVWCNCWMVRDLNMPFGGTKASGIGREGAKDSIEFYTEKKTVCVKL